MNPQNPRQPLRPPQDEQSSRNEPPRNRPPRNRRPRRTAWWFFCSGLLMLALLVLAGAWYTGLLPLPSAPDLHALLEKARSAAEPELSGERGGGFAPPRLAPPGRENGQKEGSPGSAPGAAPGTTGETPAGRSGETGKGTTDATGIPGAPGNTSGAAGAPQNARPPLSPEQEAIEAYYLARLETICRYYEGKLNGLLGNVQQEYTAARRLGQKVSVLSLANRYIAAGNALEKQCDVEFYAVLADFKAELRKNSFPLDKPREAQKEYERAKAARKRQILTAAAKLF